MRLSLGTDRRAIVTAGPSKAAALSPVPTRRSTVPRLHSLRAAVACAALIGLLAGCASSQDSSTDPSGSSSSATDNVDNIGVTGPQDGKPTVTFTAPFSVDKTQKKVLNKGSGPTVLSGERVSVDYLGLNGTDAKEFDSSYGKGVASFVMDANSVLKGFHDGLVGQTVGSRVLLAIPPADGYGVQGVPSAGIGPTDTLVFVVTIRDAKKVLSRAEGTPVPPKPGLPTVKLAANGKPTITIPSGAAPANLVVQPLIVGKGPKVTKGQVITVQYTGMIWPGGKVFDSSWGKAPASFAIGSGRVITGWDQGLVGQPVGSQILLVVPPDKGYGAAGNTQAGIKGTDTLIFVVDILDASTPPRS
jgi:peptidylprolyl isomerase